jgi:hypothetical protein
MHPRPFNAHSPGAGGSGLVQCVFRSPARNPPIESSRRGSCAAPLSEKRSSICHPATRTGGIMTAREHGSFVSLIAKIGEVDPFSGTIGAGLLIGSGRSDLLRMHLVSLRRVRHTRLLSQRPQCLCSSSEMHRIYRLVFVIIRCV